MNKYSFKPYNPLFPEFFENEKDRLLKNISGSYQIEHIGSTAVPNLGGKGVIDIMIGVSEDMKNISQQAQRLGYIFRANASTPQRLFLRTEYPEDFEKEIVFHLHIVPLESNEWRNVLAFRDYLKTHPDDLRRYAEVKQKAAKDSNQDKDKYMNIKEKMIKEILQKALIL